MGRKNYIILFLTLIVTGVTVLFSAMRVSAVDVEDVLPKATSGYAGNARQEDITWTYDTATKTLTFSGSGEMMTNSAAANIMDIEQLVLDDVHDYKSWKDSMIERLGTWYIWHEETEHVVIGEGITNIGYHAFREFNSLIDVSFPYSLQYIGAYAFYECGSIRFKSITIPGNVKEIGCDAFYKCRFLREIIIENGVEEIGDRAFCTTSIEEITFPESVHKYDIRVLKNCKRLRKVTLSSSINEIPIEFFYNCTSLREITIPKSVKKISAGAFAKTSLKSIIIPQSVEKIEFDAFYKTPLETIKLPKKLKIIGDDAFAKTSLRSITIPQLVEQIGFGVFSGTSLKTVEIPKNVKVLGGEYVEKKGVFSGNKKLRTVKIKSRKLKDVTGAFVKFPSKAVIIVPKGKKKSYSMMFYDAGLSEKVKIKESKTW